jgi:acyl carrier protein
MGGRAASDRTTNNTQGKRKEKPTMTTGNIVHTDRIAHTTDSDDTIEIIRDFIVEDILQQRNITLSASDRLIEKGYLASLDVVELVMFLEERFGIEVSPDDVTEERFATLESIARLVDDIREASRVA